ncbi:hypothetical protein [Rhodococcus sp. BP22]|uniref:hypothetical protein n=1 Tax=Rhodococcus sp. BP22 TaxID=2758566 RepID=UPI001646DD73|nr:hypothetical protein [Rhodococcus sp. BP22]
MTEPVSHLVAPVADDPVPDILENALDGSLTSPAYIVGEAMVFCGMVGSNDPWAFITEKLSGNWQAVQTAGKSLEGLAKFNAAMAEELASSTSAVMKSWEGDAADHAERYFSELGDVIARQSHSIQNMADQLDQTSIGLYEVSEAIKDLLSSLVDYLIMIGVSLSASVVAAATGLGAPAAAGFLATALLTAKIAWTFVTEIQKWLGRAWMGAQAAIGLIAGEVAAVRDTPLPQLPTSGYQFGGA